MNGLVDMLICDIYTGDYVCLSLVSISLFIIGVTHEFVRM